MKSYPGRWNKPGVAALIVLPTDKLSRNSRFQEWGSFCNERRMTYQELTDKHQEVIRLVEENRINEAMEKEKLKRSMILQVHDELNFDVFPNEIDSLRAIVKDQMENVEQLRVPLTIDMGDGGNWLEAH